MVFLNVKKQTERRLHGDSRQQFIDVRNAFSDDVRRLASYSDAFTLDQLSCMNRISDHMMRMTQIANSYVSKRGFMRRQFEKVNFLNMYLGSIGNLNQNLQAMIVQFNVGVLVRSASNRRSSDTDRVVQRNQMVRKSSQYIQSMVDKKIVKYQSIGDHLALLSNHSQVFSIRNGVLPAQYAQQQMTQFFEGALSQTGIDGLDDDNQSTCRRFAKEILAARQGGVKETLSMVVNAATNGNKINHDDALDLLSNGSSGILDLAVKMGMLTVLVDCCMGYHMCLFVGALKMN